MFFDGRTKAKAGPLCLESQEELLVEKDTVSKILF